MRNNVFCSECVTAGLKSRITFNPPVVERLDIQEFYDEDGKLHFHDPRTSGVHFNCSNGHCWDEFTKNKCWCEE